MPYNDYFNVAHLEPLSHIYGPGKRFVVWLQGCTLACEGCWNQEMWSSRPRHLIQRETLAQQILDTPDIDGVTLLGGEPLQQAENTFWLLQRLRESSALTLMLYTGYEPDELAKQAVLPMLEQNCDLIIAGRYEQSQRDIYRQWHGSTNQTMIYPEKSRLVAESKLLNEVEIIIEETGEMRVLGYPDETLLSQPGK